MEDVKSAHFVIRGNMDFRLRKEIFLEIPQVNRTCENNVNKIKIKEKKNTLLCFPYIKKQKQNTIVTRSINNNPIL